MNRLVNHLSKCKRENEKFAIFFITAGDPSLNVSLDIMLQMAENGADCIELGMPFSDPIADGPVIQRSTARALENNITLVDIFELVKQFRRHSDVPVVLMGYLNPLFRYGLEEAVRDCASAGVDGLIIADLPFEEGEALETIAHEHHVSLIYLLAPDIDAERTQSILESCSGFVYVVAQYSTTGVEHESEIDQKTIESLTSMTSLPVAVGFGISSIEKARKMADMADGIIIGSWLLKELEGAEDKAEHAGLFVSKVKRALQGQDKTRVA